MKKKNNGFAVGFVSECGKDSEEKGGQKETSYFYEEESGKNESLFFYELV